jgi:predicted ATPase
MIKHFQIRNFKILREIDFNPRTVNVLIGPNGCGKSSVLQGIDFLRAFFTSSIEVYLQSKGWNYKDIPNVPAGSKSIHWKVSVELHSDRSQNAAGLYDYSVSLSPRRYLAIGREELNYTGSSGKTVSLLRRKGRQFNVFDPASDTRYRFLAPNLLSSAIHALTASLPKKGEQFAEMRNFGAWVQGIRYFSIFDPTTLRASDRGKHTILGPHGEHLAPLLANFKKRRPHEFQKLVSRIRLSYPSLLDFSFSGQGWGWRSIRLHEKVASKEVVLNNQQIGDGMLRLVALSSFLYLDEVPTVIMFEEPENGVHPHILREMIQVLRELTLRKGKTTQVFFTTHSPYVLDEFFEDPEQVFVMNYPGRKSQLQIRQLSEWKDLHKMKESYGSLGEAWFSGAFGGIPSLVF